MNALDNVCKHLNNFLRTKDPFLHDPAATYLLSNRSLALINDSQAIVQRANPTVISQIDSQLAWLLDGSFRMGPSTRTYFATEGIHPQEARRVCEALCTWALCIRLACTIQCGNEQETQMWYATLTKHLHAPSDAMFPDENASLALDDLAKMSDPWNPKLIEAHDLIKTFLGEPVITAEADITIPLLGYAQDRGYSGSFILERISFGQGFIRHPESLLLPCNASFLESLPVAQAASEVKRSSIAGAIRWSVERSMSSLLTLTGASVGGVIGTGLVLLTGRERMIGIGITTLMDRAGKLSPVVEKTLPAKLRAAHNRGLTAVVLEKRQASNYPDVKKIRADVFQIMHGPLKGLQLLGADNLEEAVVHMRQRDTFAERQGIFHKKDYGIEEQFNIKSLEDQIITSIESQQSLLITLTGFYGIGKTHGAFRLIERVMQRYRGIARKCVYFAEGAYSTVGATDRTILEELGPRSADEPEADAAKVREALRAFTDNEPLILLLDKYDACLNSNNRPDAVAAVQRILTPGHKHSLICIVTSFEALGLPGEAETVCEVKGLPCLDPETPQFIVKDARTSSVRLFCDIAKLNLTEDDPNYKLVAKCVYDLSIADPDDLNGGRRSVPLFLQWFASRANLQNLNDLVETIDGSQLTGPDGSQPSHLIMDHYFDVIFDKLMEPDERILFCLLSLFSTVNGWSEEAARGICKAVLPQERFHSAMERLKAHQLVIVRNDGRGCFGRFIYRTAQKRFINGISEVVKQECRRRFLTYYHAFTETRKSWPDESDAMKNDWLSQIQSELYNIATAVKLVPSLPPIEAIRQGAEIVVGTWRYYDLRAPYQHGLDYIRPFIEVTVPNSNQLQAELCAAYGMLLYRRGNLGMAERYQDIAISLLQGLEAAGAGDARTGLLLGIAYNDKAIAVWRRDIRLSLDGCQSAIEKFAKEDPECLQKRHLATFYNNLGRAYRCLGCYTDAEEALNKSIELFMKIDRRTESGYPRFELALIRLAQGRRLDAQQEATGGTTASMAGERMPNARNINMLGRLCLLEGDLDGALTRHEEAAGRHEGYSGEHGQYRSKLLINLVHMINLIDDSAIENLSSLPSLTLLGRPIGEVLTRRQKLVGPSRDIEMIGANLKDCLGWFMSMQDYLNVVELLEAMSLYAFLINDAGKALSLDTLALVLRNRLGFAFPLTEVQLERRLEERLKSQQERLPDFIPLSTIEGLIEQAYQLSCQMTTSH